MLNKLKLALALLIAIIGMHSIYILRMTDDELTIENFFKRENIVLSITLLFIVLGILYVSGELHDDDD